VERFPDKEIEHSKASITFLIQEQLVLKSILIAKEYYLTISQARSIQLMETQVHFSKSQLMHQMIKELLKMIQLSSVIKPVFS